MDVASWLALALPAVSEPSKALTVVPGRIPTGKRDETLTSMAGSMRRRGMAPESILAALREENGRCDPPLADRDLERISKSVGRYEPAVVEPTAERPEFIGKWPAQLVPRLSGLYLVKGLIPTHCVVQLFGEPNSGKSAAMIDLCCHMSSGRQYGAGRTRSVMVAYLALENPISVENRVIAWCQHNKVERGDVRLFVVQGSLNLRNSVSVEAVIEFLKATEAACGERFGFIVLDTQSRAMPGANENASEDMSLMMAHTDRLRDVFDATVCLVHHCGKDSTKGGRGHSNQIGAVDVAIEVVDRQLMVRKGRDMASGKSHSFELTPVELGNDEDGDPVTVVVASLCAGRPAGVARAKFTGLAGIALAALNNLISSGKAKKAPAGHSILPSGAFYASIDEWTDAFKRAVDSKDSAYARKAFFDAKASLLKAGAIGIHDNPTSGMRFVWRNINESVGASEGVGNASDSDG